MKHLFFGELTRYKAPTLIVFLVHIAVLKYLSMGDLFAPSMAKFLIGILCYGLLGAAFAFAQVGTYRRPNQWAYLIHRPLTPKAIALSMMGSGVTLLAIAIGLPLLAITAYQDLFTAQAVDARHYLMAPYLLGFALSVYLVGAITLLSPNKAPIFLVGLVSIFITRDVPSPWLFASLCLVLLVLGSLYLLYFRPNLFTQPRSMATRLAMALSLQYGVYWILVGALSIVYSLGASIHSSGMRSFADHAWNDYFPPGTTEYLGYRNAEEALRHGLRELEEGQRLALENQLTFTDVLELAPHADGAPSRHQPLILDKTPGLYDAEQEIQWTFHHDEMAFQGLQVRRAEAMGWMGPGDAPSFGAIPSTAGSRWVTLGDSLYGFDAKEAQLNLRMTAPGAEAFTSGVRMEGRIAAVLTKGHLHILDPRDVRRAGRALAPTLSISIPTREGAGYLRRVQVAPLLDGYLVSFVLDGDGERGFREPHQITQLAYLSGEVEVLGDISLASGLPAWSQYRMYLASPGMELIYDGLGHIAGAPGPSFEAILGRDLPGAIPWAGLLLMLASGTLAFVTGSKRTSSLGERMLWTALALLFSAPALLCFWATHPAPEELRARHPTQGTHPLSRGVRA